MKKIVAVDGTILIQGVAYGVNAYFNNSEIISQILLEGCEINK